MSPEQAETIAARRGWLAILAKAPPQSLNERWAEFLSTRHEMPRYRTLRKPETALVMLRARAGGTGEQFNFGEMTVTRCAVRLDSGEAGVGYVMGREPRKAEIVAIADALLQCPETHEPVMTAIVAPLERLLDREAQTMRAKAAATRADFFTMVRGA